MKITLPTEAAAKFQSIMDSPKRHMGHTLGIEFLEVSLDEISARMPVDERTHQPMGLLHGGASVALAETLASVGAWLNLADEQQAAVGLEINANHIRAVRSGYVLGKARPIHKGKTTQVWHIDIETEDGKAVCVSRCTLAVVKGRR